MAKFLAELRDWVDGKDIVAIVEESPYELKRTSLEDSKGTELLIRFRKVPGDVRIRVTYESGFLVLSYPKKDGLYGTTEWVEVVIGEVK